MYMCDVIVIVKLTFCIINGFVAYYLIPLYGCQLIIVTTVELWMFLRSLAKKQFTHLSP